MAVKWTDSQLEAIENGGNIVVSAGAGSGKTAVLVEKIIRLVTEQNVDLDNILVVTFTKAATADVKEKITEALYKKIAAAPDNRHLQRQAAKIGNASIDTIDAFCGKAVRRYFEKLDISCNFRMLDENEGLLIGEEVLEECIDQEYEKYNDGVFEELVSQMSERRGDEGLKTAILEIHKVLETTADEQAFRAMCLSRFDDAYYIDSLSEVLKGQFNQLLLLYKECKGLCENEDKNEGIIKAILINTVEIAGFLSLLEQDYFQFTEKYRLFKPETLRVNSKWDEELKNQIADIRDATKKIYERISEYTECSKREYELDCEKQKRLVKRLFEINDRYEQLLWTRKTDMGAVSFADIEKLTLRLFTEKTENGLVPSDTAMEYAAIYKYMFIDEYQDTNQLQDTLFSVMSTSENNLFLVGDVKQSIYSFRSARPELFAEKISGDAMKTLLLNSNFRSRCRVVDGINYLFTRVMSVKTGGVDYDDSQSLKFGAEYYEKDDSDCELHIVHGSEQEEFEHIADIINRLVSEENYVCDKKCGLRRTELRDIAVLLRSPKYSSAKLERILVSKGIPAYSDTHPVFFSNEEIVLATSMLSVIDNPTQDIMLVSVLSSAIGGFTHDELAKIRLAKKNCNFYEALKAYAEEDGKAAAFVKKLERLRLLSLNTSVAGMLTRIYDEFNLMTACAAMPGGKLRKTNLRLLLEYASNYEKTGFKGIFNFNLYLQKIKERKTEIPGAKAYSDDSNVVRIMSIHRSKGLEFPVVILAQTDKQYYTVELKQDFLVDRKYGIAMRLRDHERTVKFDTLSRISIRESKRFDLISEELRIWYVAMTRAREKLIVTASCPFTSKGGIKGLGNIKTVGDALDVWGVRYSSAPIEFIYNALKDGSAEEKSTEQGITKTVNKKASWEIYYVDPEKKQYTHGYDAQDSAGELTPDAKEVKKNLEFVYPYSVQEGFPSKTSVTAIKKLIEMKKDEPVTAKNLPEYKMQFERPAFITDDNKLTASEKGTALHTFLQYADLSELSDENAVRQEINRLVDSEFITPKQADSLNIASIVDFGNSSTLKKAVISGYIERERRFNIKVELGFLAKLTNEKPNSDPNGLVVMQGVIDCLCYDGESYTIIDYKTDRNITEKQLRERYVSQMELYKYAVKEITDCEAVKCVIYSFYLKKEINV